MCVQVYPNGFGKAEGTHVTMSTCIMRGEYDDKLIWPFQGEIVVELLNQTTEKDEGNKLSTMMTVPRKHLLEGELHLFLIREILDGGMPNSFPTAI